MVGAIMSTARSIPIILLAIVLPLVIFAKLMGGHAGLPLVDRFSLLSVPAMSAPFGDMRNIQAAAACLEQSRPIYGDSACVRLAAGARSIYPQIQVPPLNYPPIWVRLYGWLDDQSESYLLLCGWINAAALILTLMLMCLRWSPLLFPVFLFSPPVMLCIERGNVDGITFAATMLPLMLLRSPLIRGVGLGIAAGLKVFPVFALLAVGFVTSRSVRWLLCLGGLTGLGLLYESWLALPSYIGQASGGFDAAYGLGSWRYATWLVGHPSWVLAIQATFLSLAALVAWRAWRVGVVDQLAHEAQRLEEPARAVLAASLAIFMATFIFSASWAYRIVYLMPALLILSTLLSQSSKRLVAVGLFLFWVPLLGVGWRYFNVLACVVAMLCLPWVLALFNRSNCKSDAPSAVVSDARYG
jgi:hypothetical protein